MAGVDHRLSSDMDSRIRVFSLGFSACFRADFGSEMCLGIMGCTSFLRSHGSEGEGGAWVGVAR